MVFHFQKRKASAVVVFLLNHNVVISKFKCDFVNTSKCVVFNEKTSL